LEADLPDFINGIIKNEIKTNSHTNFSLLSNEDKIKQEKLLNERSSFGEEQPVREMVEDNIGEGTDMEYMVGRAEEIMEEPIMDEDAGPFGSMLGGEIIQNDRPIRSLLNRLIS
jgi:hypothetical protein